MPKKQEMLDTTFYKQVTDSKITDAIQTATDEAKKDGGFYRTVQLGTDDENAANLNRVEHRSVHFFHLFFFL